MRRLVTFLMMIALTVVSSTSLAAAMCNHRNAQAHAAALQDGNVRVSAAAHLEDAAGALVSKKGALSDAGAFSLPAFIMPDAFDELSRPEGGSMRPRPADAAKLAGLSVPPLLHPPAA